MSEFANEQLQRCESLARGAAEAMAEASKATSDLRGKLLVAEQTLANATVELIAAEAKIEKLEAQIADLVIAEPRVIIESLRQWLDRDSKSLINALRSVVQAATV